MTPVPQGCVGLCMGLPCLVLFCQRQVAEEASTGCARVVKQPYPATSGGDAPWRARDGTLRVKETEEAISDAAVLSRSLTIQRCSFKCDHQLKAVNRSGVQ